MVRCILYGVRRSGKVKIVLCDDHPLVADGIALLLQALAPDLLVERHTTAAGLFAAAVNWQHMDLVLLDLGLPDTQGMQALRHLRSLRDDVPVVVISGITERSTILEAIDQGAMGFVPKTSSTVSMLEALQTVLNGDVYLPPMADTTDPSRAQVGLTLNLTPKQWDILRCILEGKPIKRIATTLNIAECTVKTHVTPILRALGVTSRTEAIVRVSQLGLRIPPREH
jgi:DNA-binding NarL/FixJ family response regulator